jgi:hypothetical protein
MPSQAYPISAAVPVTMAAERMALHGNTHVKFTTRSVVMNERMNRVNQSPVRRRERRLKQRTSFLVSA